MTTAFLNGEYLPIEACKVSVLDRGFTFGESVYEVLPVFNGKIFECQPHLDRLHGSLNALKIPDIYSDEYLRDVFHELGVRNGYENYSIYLQITGGTSPREHAADAVTPPTIFSMPSLLPKSLDLNKGISVITHEDFRWTRCNIKTTSLIANTLLRKLAKKEAVDEVILHRDKLVTEGASSNVFMVRGGELYTAPSDNLILPGITRSVVLRLARQYSIPVHEQRVAVDLLYSSDEVWMTSATCNISPVTTIDQHPIGNGKPGSLWKQFSAWLMEARNQTDVTARRRATDQ